MAQRPPDLDANGRPVTAAVRPPDIDADGTAAPARDESRPRGLATIGDFVGDVGIGIVKGGTNTAIGLGEMVHSIPGVSAAVDYLYGRPVSARSFTEARQSVQPTNTAQRVGFYSEQIGEFFTPIGAAGKTKALLEIGKSGVLTGLQGGSKADVAIDAGLSAVIPGAGFVRRAGKAVGDQAVPLVRAAIKPTVTALRRIANGPVRGLDAKGNALVRFIIDNKLSTPEDARALFQRAEHELQRVLTVKNAPTDAPTRATRYLEALERSAAKQGLGADDVAQINQAAAELLQGPMGRDVITMVPTPHPTLLGANGQPLTVLRPQTSRALRTDVSAAEALDSARSSGRWSTNKQWGEQKGTAVESRKAVERAQRDAAKQAVPEARDLLRTQSQAISSEGVLDRMASRTGNRDAVSLPAAAVAAGELAKGNLPILSFATNWLRNNQLKAGMWADSLAKAIEKGNAPLVADILKRLGVGSASQAMRTPATAR